MHFKFIPDDFTCGNLVFREFQIFAVSSLANKAILPQVTSCGQSFYYVLYCALTTQNYGYYAVVKVAGVKYALRNMQILFAPLFVSV